MAGVHPIAGNLVATPENEEVAMGCRCFKDSESEQLLTAILSVTKSNSLNATDGKSPSEKL